MPVRTIAAGHRGVRGRFPSRKAGGRMVSFESRLERNFFLLLEADRLVARFEEQPVKIEFVGRHRRRSYTPDCRVDYCDGSIDIVEVKYVAALVALDPDARADFEEAQDAARRFCSDRGWKFRLMTDHDIETPALSRAQVLRAHAAPPPSLVTLRPIIEGLLRSHGPMPLNTLISAVDSQDSRAAVLHLVWMGVVIDEPITAPRSDTRVWLAGDMQ